ncbi:MAG: glycosyltransferase family 2 protein, partial [Bacteroidota bacterium]
MSKHLRIYTTFASVQLFLKKNLLSALPKVAVVILNWNGIHHLRQFLPSVCASTYAHLDIIVADNASTDDSVSFVQQQFPQVKILRSDVNYGYAGGYNFFLKQVDADYYILLNSDVEVSPVWIEPVIELMERNHTIAACQPKIRSYHKKDFFEYAGASGGWLDSLGYPFSRGRVFDTLEKDEGQYNDTAPVFWASGAAFFIRAKVFHKANGFDASFFAHQEEIYLCWRLQNMGHQIFVCPASVVYHVGGGTLPSGSMQKVHLNFRNNLIMVARNWPLREVFWKVPIRLFLDALSAWKSLIQGHPQYWLGVWKAHVYFMKWVIRNPDKVGLRKRVSNPQGILQGSIVWQYFMLG